MLQKRFLLALLIVVILLFGLFVSKNFPDQIAAIVVGQSQTGTNTGVGSGIITFPTNSVFSISPVSTLSVTQVNKILSSRFSVKVLKIDKVLDGPLVPAGEITTRDKEIQALVSMYESELVKLFLRLKELLRLFDKNPTDPEINKQIDNVQEKIIELRKAAHDFLKKNFPNDPKVCERFDISVTILVAEANK